MNTGISRGKGKKYIFLFWIIYTLPIIAIGVIFVLISNGKLGKMPTFEELENPERNLASEVFSDDGKLLGKYYIQNRVWTGYDKISPSLIDALIATEDVRFYQHSGIDIRGLGRVFVKTFLLRQEQSGGGSTITQQLAKNLFPRDTSRTHLPLARLAKLALTKFKEWVTAVKLERSYTKEEIITMYLNIFDFLYQAVGIHSAADIYFQTTPDSLTLEQAAMLVGMVKNPAYYNPVRRPEITLKRRNVVLSQMLKYGYLDKATYDSVKQLPLEVHLKVESHNLGPAPYLREYLRTTMMKSFPEREYFFTDEQYQEALYQWNNNPLYGWCSKNKKPDGENYNIYKDGLKIYTTINYTFQKYAEEAVREHLGGELQDAFFENVKHYRHPPFSDDLTTTQIRNIMERAMRRTDRYRSLKRRGAPMDTIMKIFNTPVQMKVFSWKGIVDTVMSPMDSLRYYKYFIRSGLMSFDPHTGYVKAYVGGPDFRFFKFDAVTAQKRQVGSTIKPFLYTLAMQNGYTPCYKVPDVPQTFKDNDSVWIPKSSGRKEFWGKMVTLKWGLANSENYISAWLMKQFNPQSVIDIMRKMGIRSPIDPVNSIFLGTSDLSLYELTGAYGTFANKGVFVQPLFVTRIEDKNGNMVATFRPYFNEAISEKDAYLMINLLEGVVREGTAIRLRYKYELMNPIGGKTGTTQNHSDGWFMGVTPSLVTGVWSGWEDRSVHFTTLHLGQGANMALPIFALYLKKIYNDPQYGIMQTEDFEAPQNFHINLKCDEENGNTRNYDFDF
ncbi:MAG: transglycosylase domain-containing protein [Bacteroidales bacterium]|nr:transglycosylase domain-containing protein [Bacteroidales bacterium]